MLKAKRLTGLAWSTAVLAGCGVGHGPETPREVPRYTMVVAPGRDLAIMVETAVRKCLLAQRGIQDERDFLDAINVLAAQRRIEDGGGE